MVVTAPPDIVGALLVRLRSFAVEWSALGLDSHAGWKGSGSGLRISGEIGGGEHGWKMPTRGLIIRRAGGPIVGDDYAMGLYATRIDTVSYGPTGELAGAVWALLHAILVPKTGEQRYPSFTVAGCRVGNIVPEVGPVSDTERDTGYRYVFAPYIVQWVEVTP